MSDDLIARAHNMTTPELIAILRSGVHRTMMTALAGVQHDERCLAAADRLAALEAENARLRAERDAAWIAGRDAAADECDRLRASYARSADGYDEDDPLRGRIKYSGAAVAVASENIRALTPEASHD
jgi:hypothetical protein